MKNFFLLILLSLFSGICSGQEIAPDILSKKWNAHWIVASGESADEYGVYHFRKTITLPEKPTVFIVHVSADNRYKLYVNGQMVSHGPARGDLFHWNFETLDISYYLKPGKNVLSAVVWNFGDYRAEGQISLRTAFILQGNSSREEIVNTNSSWKALRNKGYEPLQPDLINTYYAAGPGEKIDYRKYPSAWETEKFNDEGWQLAQQLNNGIPKGVFDWPNEWMLVPRSIPQMELIPQRLFRVRNANGIQLPGDFPAGKVSFTVPANKKVNFLLDQDHLTNAYPVLHFSQGKDAVISLSYAEALYIDEKSDDWRNEQKKGNRNEIEGKRFVGLKDEIISNGSIGQMFSSLWWRTYRYLKIEIQTSNEPLVIEDLYGVFTGYPLELNARAEPQDTILKKILEVGWRTARLCAAETYMDCPYYEQLQYIGDTRIQALVSMYNSNDDRLVRNAILQFNNSRMAEGITLSRYPTAHPQQIPTFSLWWIAMVHDYWMYRSDKDFVKQMLPGIRQVMSFFEKYRQGDGSLKNAPYWEFSDWKEGKGWSNGFAPIGKNGNSSALDLQYLLAYYTAAELEEDLGMKAFAEQYRTDAKQLAETIKSKYWSKEKQLFADVPEKNLFSQYSNVFAVLAGLVQGEDARQLMKRTLNDTSLIQTTIYSKYYLNQALLKAGLGNMYLDLLAEWKENLSYGMTTWAETSEINSSRSDCHAWGSSPNIEFYRIVLGIDTDAPCFSKVKIEPHLGKLTDTSGSIPHPKGNIAVSYKQRNEKWIIELSLPENTAGRFVWKGKQYLLKGGQKNILKL